MAFLRRLGGGRLGWGRVSLVTTTDDLNTSAHEPVERGFQNGLGHGTDLVPDDHPRDVFVSHSLRGPLGPAPTKEAVVRLGLHFPGPHLFGQTVCRGEDQGVSDEVQFNRSCFLPLSPPPFRYERACLDNRSS